MKKKIIKLLQHPLIAGSAIIFIGSFIASLLSYSFNLLLGRFLVASDYGTYATLIAFLAIFGIFPGTLMIIFAKFAAKHKAKDENQKISVVFILGLRIVLFFSSIILLILCLSIFYTSSFLHIKDIRLLVIIFLAIFLSIISALPVGLLQGQMRLHALSLLTISTPLLKVLIGLLFLFFGLRIFGVTLAIFISSLIPICVIFLLLRSKHSKEHISSEDKSMFFREFKQYSIAFFLSALGIAILTSADIILLKHFYSPEKTGQYAALSLMGKSIFYLTSPIYLVFFPLIAQKKEKKESIYKTLILAISIIALFSVSIAFVYFFFPAVILHIFFPADIYKPLAPFLGPFSLYIVVFSLAMLFNNFLLSIGKTGVYKINLSVAILFVFLLCIFHATFYQVIWVLFLTSLLLLCLDLLYYASAMYGKK